MPRNRTVRLAVTGSSVQRAAAPRYPSRSRTVLQRRLVVGLLVLLSLLMITVYLREAPEGALHGVQGAGATVLMPFQVAAERVARPFRDAYGYVADLVDAKSENERLRKEMVRLRQQAIQNLGAVEQLRTLQQELAYRDAPGYPADYRDVQAAVIAPSAAEYEQRIVIAAGSRDGIRRNDAVVTADGLVGKVAKTSSRTSRVTLLTDASSSVAAVVLAPQRPTGLVRAGRAGSGVLQLTRVKKRFRVERGDVVTTAGPDEGSLYPRGIPIGTVTLFSQSDTDLFKVVQVEPGVDFDSLHSVVVLVPRGRS